MARNGYPFDVRLLSLSLEQFRTYSGATLALGEGSLHLLIGKNGVGKTNLIEAVSVLSLTRSCRGAEDEDLRTWGTDHYRVRGDVEADDGRTMRLEVVSVIHPRKKRACFVADVQKPVGDYAGTLPVASFLPEDLTLFRGSPAERRRFLDQILGQVSPEYLQALSGYQQVLKQRNSLLKALRESGSPQDLLPWEEQLARHGALLTMMRQELLQTVNLTLPDELSRLGETWDAPHLLYERQTASTTVEELERELLGLLLQHRRRDMDMLSTSVGPHREDWQLVAGGRPIPTWGSRGQERVALIALVLLQVAYLEIRRGERPIILLDDVFSELDAGHQQALLSSLSGHQILLSGTDVPEGLHDGIVWHVSPGQAIRA